MHSNNDGMPNDWKPTPNDPFENFMNDKKIAYMQNNAGTFNTVHVTEWAHEYARKLERELATEKQKALKLVELLIEAVELMKRPPAISTGDRAWHQHDVIIQIDKTISAYSTDSGDGEKG